MFSNFAAHAKPRVALYCAHRNVICFCKVIKSKEDLNLRLSEELGCLLTMTQLTTDLMWREEFKKIVPVRFTSKIFVFILYC